MPAFLKGWNLGLFVNFSKFSCSWIRKRNPNTDPDFGPGDPNTCGSGSTTLLGTNCYSKTTLNSTTLIQLYKF